MSLFLCVVCVRECTHAERLEPDELLLIQVGNNYNACMYILRVSSIKYRIQMNFLNCTMQSTSTSCLARGSFPRRQYRLYTRF